MPNIKIDQRYWEIVKREYSDWRAAWVREAAQNSLDAGATRIDITTSGDYIKWADNGKGMTKNTLKTKFMAIGASGKEFSGVGGFGVAKSILCFAHKNYNIYSRDYVASGNGEKYTIKPHSNTPGCTLEVYFNEYADLSMHLKRWLAHSNVDCDFYVNGVLVNNSYSELKLTEKYLLTKSTEFTSIRVRVNGQYMFEQFHHNAGTVGAYLDLSDSSWLTVNRSGFNVQAQDKVNDILKEFFHDPDKFESESQPHVTIYVYGENELSGDDNAQAGHSGHNPVVSGYYTTLKLQVKNSKMGFTFALTNYIKNYEIPAEYTPEEFTHESFTLARQWVKLLENFIKVLGIKETIIPGFSFKISKDEHKTMATCMQVNYRGATGYIISVCPLWIRTKSSIEKIEQKLHTLKAAAIHELAHTKEMYHSEDYANYLTDFIAKIFEVEDSLR